MWILEAGLDLSKHKVNTYFKCHLVCFIISHGRQNLCLIRNLICLACVFGYFCICIFVGDNRMNVFVYLEVVVVRGVARRFLFLYSPTIPPAATLTLLYFCISIFGKSIFMRFPICTYAKFLFFRLYRRIRTHLSAFSSGLYLLSAAQKFHFSAVFAFSSSSVPVSLDGRPNSKVQNNFQVRAGKLLSKD